MAQGRTLVNPSTGILGVAPGKSSDHAGEGALILYVDQNMNANVPATVNGMRTVVIPTTALAVTFGAAPQSLLDSGPFPALQGEVLNNAIAAKQLVAPNLMRQNPVLLQRRRPGRNKRRRKRRCSSTWIATRCLRHCRQPSTACACATSSWSGCMLRVPMRQGQHSSRRAIACRNRRAAISICST